MIGKRKRETTVASRKKAELLETEPEKTSNNKQENHHDLFRQYFEARFKPIEQRVDIREADVDVEEEEEEGESVDSESESEWDGLSEDEEEEEEQPVEVVAYDASQRREDDELARAEFKSFMTSKPPSTTSKPSKPSKPTTSRSSPETATDSLKNDLSLQRLLQESHLLTNSPSTTLTPTGKNRHKATDLRIQSLSTTTKPTPSIYTQEKMPLAHRRGIEGKAGEREERRRREARENGVVLEKERKGSKKDGGKVRKRERGVGGPGVGSFRGGMLKLSRRDVEEIEGPKRKGRGGKGGRGRGRGGKR